MNFSFLGKVKKLGITPVFPLVVLGNIWIWRMFTLNFIVGVILILSTYLILTSLGKSKLNKLLIICYLVLFLFSLKGLNLTSLTKLNKQQEVLQIQRLKLYPPVKITIGTRTIWIPAAHWLEERPETLTFYRLQHNLGEVLDPNLYFFANHPNERVGITELEKFPYILLPLFLIGFFAINFRKNLSLIALGFVLPIIYLVVGNFSPNIEPFILFPFIAACGILGIEYVSSLVLKNKNTRLKIAATSVFILFYFLIVIQIFLNTRP